MSKTLKMTREELEGQIGALSQELIDSLMDKLKLRIQHTTSIEELKALSPGKAMYAASVYLLAKTLVSDVIVQASTTERPGSEIVQEVLESSAQDVYNCMNAIREQMMMEEALMRGGNGTSH